MAKIAKSYGQGRTSASLLNAERHRQSLEAIFSPSKTDTNHSVSIPASISLQNTSSVITSIHQNFPIHSSSTADRASLGCKLRSAAPRLVPAASPTRLIFSTTNKRPICSVDLEKENSLKGSARSSLLASPIHGQCPSTREDALCRNTTEMDTNKAAADLEILKPMEIDNETTAILAPRASPKPQPPLAMARLATYTAGNYSSTMSRKWAGDAINVSQKNRIRKELTTIELRLDESNIRRKVQTTVGVDSSPGWPPVYDTTYPRDPFADETSFEENLFDGLLCECPTGSSTPKSTMLMAQLHRNGEGDDGCSHHFAIELETLHAEKPDRRIDMGGSCKGKTAIESIIPGYGRVKKHPSPSKKALEDLEMALAMYTRLKPFEDGDETDELVKDERGALSAADHNKAMRQDRKFAVPEMACAYRIRHSLPYRPTLKNTQDIDELRC